jgi:pilus assembly protein CpaE
MTHALHGRQVLASGALLDPTAREVLQGAVVRHIGVEALAGSGLQHGPRYDLVIIDGDGIDTGRLIPWMEALAREGAASPLLLMGAHLPTRLVRAMMQLPKADLIETPFTASTFAETVNRLLATAPNGGAPSRCWTVMGAVGGCGATMLAAEIAAALQSREGGAHRVCLVDLNLVDGATAAYLGVTANMQLSQATAPERIDAAVLAAFTSQAGEGIDVLAAPRDPAGFQTATAPMITRILDLACQTYDWVIVDLPRHRQAWTMDVIVGSDELLLVSELTVPALLATRASAAEIEAETDAPSPRIILNRIATRMFAAAPSLAEAERALGRKAAGGISSDWEAAAASVNLGGFVRRHRPRSKIVKDVDQLVERIISESSAAPGTQTRVA